MTESSAVPVPPFPPRILAISGGFVTIGGAEQMVFTSLKFFRNRGSAVHCIVSDWENERVVAAAEAIGATWSEGKYKHRLRWRNQTPARTIRGAFGVLETSADLVRKVRRVRPDVVFVSDYETVLRNAAGLAWVRARGIPVVLHLHNSPPARSEYRFLYRWVIDPLVSRYAIVSLHMKDELAALGIAPEKICYVNNFVASPRDDGSPPARDYKRILFAGQMIPQKGLDILLDAFAIVAARDASAHLEVAARTDGWIAPAYESYRTEVLSRIERPDLDGRVTMLGWRNDVPALLQRSGIHCAPSRPEMYEGMPLICLEAKQAGTPSVGPNSGAFSDLITHRIDGWLCNELSPQAIARGLFYFLEDAERCEAAGKSALASAAKFSQSEFESRWESLFDDLRQGGRSQRHVLRESVSLAAR